MLAIGPERMITDTRIKKCGLYTYAIFLRKFTKNYNASHTLGIALKTIRTRKNTCKMKLAKLPTRCGIAEIPIYYSRRR